MSLLFLLGLHLCVLSSLVSRASGAGQLALFLDEECYQPSVINPSVNLALNVCLVTKGALGIAVQTLPQCSSGSATLILFRDTSCANPVNSDLQYNNCYFDGPDGVPAVIFACGTGATHATATSTVSAGSSSLPVATNAPASPTSDSSGNSPVPSSNEAAPSITPATSTSPNPSETSSGSAGSSGSGGSGLSQKSQIALGVGLPVGSIVVALLAWLVPCNKRRHF